MKKIRVYFPFQCLELLFTPLLYWGELTKVTVARRGDGWVKAELLPHKALRSDKKLGKLLKRLNVLIDENKFSKNAPYKTFAKLIE